MNGNDIFKGLKYIGDDLVEEAEFGKFPKRTKIYKRPFLAAALIAISLLLAGCAVAIAHGWFSQYFEQKSGQPLSEKQIKYLAENEQILTEGQTQDEWTVQLRSALTDGSTGYIIIGVTAPEGVDLEPEIVDGSITEWFGAGNDGMSYYNMPKGTPRIITTSESAFLGGSVQWREDGDGKDNTKNMVFQLSPGPWDGVSDPFGPDTEYHIHIENIVREYDDKEYLEELLSTKYAGQTDYMLESEEVTRLKQTEILAEGIWDFTVHFEQETDSVELLTEPVKVMGFAYREGPPLNEFINDTIESYEEVQLTSVKISPLSVTVTYVCDVGCRLSTVDTAPVRVVMNDGSQMDLWETGGGSTLDSITLDAQAPIVLDQVNHVLLPDGTKIPMP